MELGNTSRRTRTYFVTWALCAADGEILECNQRMVKACSRDAARSLVAQNLDRSITVPDGLRLEITHVT